MSTEQKCTGLIGSNTEVTINFDYTEIEHQSLDSPGCGAIVEISTITVLALDETGTGNEFDDDIIDDLSQETIDAFEVKCHEYMENQ